MKDETRKQAQQICSFLTDIIHQSVHFIFYSETILDQMVFMFIYTAYQIIGYTGIQYRTIFIG